jgi:hypothetical protein
VDLVQQPFGALLQLSQTIPTDSIEILYKYDSFLLKVLSGTNAESRVHGFVTLIAVPVHASHM